MKMTATKKALISSVLAMLLCFTMLLSTTFAWFTDTVTSANNKIQSGTLKLDLEVLENGAWTSIKTSSAPLFNYDKWEPGYTEFKILKIENEGTLALKWYATFSSTTPLSILADVIDVYVLPSATEIGVPADRNLDGYTKVGTLAEFVNTIENTTNGVLYADGTAGDEAYLGIAIKMREEADNNYQGLDLGGAFDITILATQLNSESDSFDENYDKDAVLADYYVTDANGLIDTLVNATSGKVIVMMNDVEMEAETTAPYGNKYAVKLDGAVLDGNGNELYMECYGDDYGIMTSGGTVKNITIKEGCRAVMIMYPTEDVVLDNVNIGGDGVLYPINTGEAGATGVKLIVTNSTLAGWTSFSNIESASFTNVKFEQGTYYNDIYGRVLKPFVNTTLTDCSFIEHMNLDLSGLTQGHKVTIKNCTVNGQAVTASVFTVPSTDADYDTELFTVDLPSWASSVNDCIIFE